MNHRIRIFFSLIVAFLVVFLYGKITSTPYVSPTQSNSIKNMLSKLKFPRINLTKLFTLRFNPGENEINSPNQNVDFITPPPLPSPTPTSPPPATSGVVNRPSISAIPTAVNQYRPTTIPTKVPTKAPAPTKPPKPTPIPQAPAVNTEVRPGSTLKEIYEDVQDRMCIPAALLYAFQQAETGAWWPVNSASSKVKTYNKYGWWLDGSGSSCTGMGYHTQIGIVPSDAADAGTVCQKPIPSGADQAIMGLWQISKYEEDAAKKSIGKIIKGSIDRRVIFDNAVIFAIITKNRLGDPPKNCSDWPADAIKTAAEKHYGTCGDNYCNKVLNYYKQY
jgi:hypothetical protein